MFLGPSLRTLREEKRLTPQALNAQLKLAQHKIGLPEINLLFQHNASQK